MKKIIAPVLLTISILFVSFQHISAQINFASGIRLVIKDRETGRPLPFVSVSVREWDMQKVTNESGMVWLPYSAGETDSVHVRLYYVGKKPLEVAYHIKPGASLDQTVLMEPLSLTINEVEVNATRGRGAQSNSSVTIERAAIEQIQAYSLADVLQLLPGKKIMNPDLQNQQMLNLRSAGGLGSATRNNAFGIGLYVDDVPFSNNGNMQTENISHGGRLQTFVPPSTGQANVYAANGGAANGFDLRQMAVGNIEKIEVISGVAPARYGDITDGAVLIERSAGVSPLAATLRFQNGTTNAGVTKGFKLAGKGGLINTSFDYINSAADPRDRLKTYNRVNAGVLWTRFLDSREKWKQTISVDVFTTLDRGKADPEAVSKTYVKISNQGFRTSVRGSVAIERPWMESVSYTLGVAYSSQEDYSERWINSGIKPVTDRMETGLAEGQFTPPNFTAVERITGKPLNIFARLESGFHTKIAGTSHHISYGANFSYDDNLGKGRQYDPLRPRSAPQSFKAERPEDFSTVKHLAQLGLYAQDNFNVRLGDVVLRNALGFRADRQGKYWSYSPRYNMSVDLNQQWSLNAAFGMATKAPSLTYLYPGKTYFDIVLLSSYVADPARNLNLTYTEVQHPVNTHLKQARSTTVEGGVSYRGRFFSGSLTAFYKQTADGFTSAVDITPRELPNYVITSNPAGQKPVYEQQGTRKYELNLFKVNNNSSTRNKGLELFINTKKIAAIQTSFDFSTSYVNTYSYTVGTYVSLENTIDWTQAAIRGRYESGWVKAEQIISTLSTTHHIAPLGILLNLRIQAFWLEDTRTPDAAKLPVGYYDQQYNYHPIPEKERDSPQYAHLSLKTKAGSYTSQPFIYTNYHLRLAKEIKKKYRFSFYANNFLNYRPSYLNPNSTKGEVIELNQVPAFGGEIVFKF